MNLFEHPVGHVCWLDLGVADVEATANFYSRLFGWSVAEPDETGYQLASLDGQPVAAFGPAEDPGPPYWTLYVHTSDIAATSDAVKAAGGTIISPPTPAGEAGVAATVRDHRGGPLSLWQPGTHRGTHASGRHGTFAGVQLRTPDPDDAHAFLSAVLGWQLRSVGTITLDGRTVATWKQAPTTARAPGPSPWLLHFLVADVNATFERAQQLGATPVHGESAVVVDPAGALFGLTAITRPETQSA